MSKILLILLITISCSDNPKRSDSKDHSFENKFSKEDKKDSKPSYEKEHFDINNIVNLDFLYTHIYKSDLDRIKRIFKENNIVDINIKNKSYSSYSPLYAAILRGDPEIVKFFLTLENVDLNLIINDKTILSYAIERYLEEKTQARLEIIELLVNNDAKVYNKEALGNQPLELAFSFFPESSQILEILLSKDIETLDPVSENEFFEKMGDSITARYDRYGENLSGELKKELDNFVITFLDRVSLKNLPESSKRNLIFCQREILLDYLLAKKIKIGFKTFSFLEGVINLKEEDFVGLDKIKELYKVNDYEIFYIFKNNQFKNALKSFLNQLKERKLIIYEK